MDIWLVITTGSAIFFVLFFIGLVIWAERELKKHPELIGQRDKNKERKKDTLDL